MLSFLDRYGYATSKPHSNQSSKTIVIRSTYIQTAIAFYTIEEELEGTTSSLIIH